MSESKQIYGERWVQHFGEEYAFRLSERINDFCRVNHTTPISISVYKIGGSYAAEVIMENL